MKKSNRPLIKQAKLNVKPPDYHPTREELNKEFNLPGASIEEMRQAVFRPVELPKSAEILRSRTSSFSKSKKYP